MTITFDATSPLAGKTAVVIGASRGIGAAIARSYAHAGAAVAVAARDNDALEALVGELSAAGRRAIGVPTDVTDPDSVSELFEQVLDVFDGLDIACNNAGLAHPPTRLADVSVEDFDAAIAVNQRGVFLALKHELPAMLDAGGGAIVNISSTAGVEAVGGLAPYVTTKHGVEALTRVAALDYAAAGIRVNAIAPGPILTDNLRRAGTEAQHAAAAAMPMQRIGQPEEVAAVWLSSDAAAFVTGTTLVLDGGKLAGTSPFSWDRA